MSLSRWKSLPRAEQLRRMAQQNEYRRKNRARVDAWNKKSKVKPKYKAWVKAYAKKRWLKLKSDPVLLKKHYQQEAQRRRRYAKNQKILYRKWKKNLGRKSWLLLNRYYYYKHRYGAEYAQPAFALRELRKEIKCQLIKSQR